MAKNLSIVANGISGDEGHLLGYNVSDNGIYTPAIGDVVRGTTATYVAQDGLLKTAPPNVARVDYTNGVAELLLEKSSTNLVTYSEDFSNGSWLKLNSSVSQVQEINPKGEDGCYKLSATSLGGFVYINPSLSTPINVCFSIFAKADSCDFLRLKFSGYDSESTEVYFDLVNGVVTSESGGIDEYGIEKVGDNGWHRCYIGEGFGSNGSGLMAVYPSNSNGTNAGGSVFVDMAQLENIALKTPTSYIPTNGGTASRSADSLGNFGSSQIIDSESGVLLFESVATTISPNYNLVLMRNNTSTKFVRLGIVSNNEINANIVDGSVDVGISSSIVNSSVFKAVIKYSNSKPLEFYVNGSLIGIGGEQQNIPINSFTTFSISQGSGVLRARKVKHLPYNTDISTL